MVKAPQSHIHLYLVCLENQGAKAAHGLRSTGVKRKDWIKSKQLAKNIIFCFGYWGCYIHFLLNDFGHTAILEL